MTVLPEYHKTGRYKHQCGGRLEQRNNKNQNDTYVVVERCPKERTLGFYENGQIVVTGKNLQSVLFVKKISIVMM